MSSAIQLVGVALIVAGTLLMSVPVGLIVAGVATVLVGLAVTK